MLRNAGNAMERARNPIRPANTAGIEIAARYSFPPNCHGYCGPSSFVHTLKEHLERKKGNWIGKGDGIVRLKTQLSRFCTLHAYLKFIAREKNSKKINGFDPFDRDVVEAFWIGNELLEDISRADLSRFIRRDLFPKSDSRRANRLADGLPEGMVPHHSFNALYVKFVTGRVKRSVKNFDSCCITFGKVLSVSADRKTAHMGRASVSWNAELGFCFAPLRSTVALERMGVRFLDLDNDPLRKDDLVSVHWGMAVEKIRPSACRAIRKYTQINMDAVNSLLHR